MPSRGALIAAAVAAGVAALAGSALQRWGPAPAADVARGSEDAFATGLHQRELPAGGAPLRWTGQRARFRFAHLPRAPARLEVRLRAHRTPVTIVAGGAVLGVLEPGQRAADYPLPERRDRELTVALTTEGFVAGDGRVLGAQLGLVRVRPAWREATPGGLALVVLPSVVLALAASAWGPTAALLAGLFGAGGTVALLAPSGVLFSPWAASLAALLTGGTILVRLFAGWSEGRRPGSGPWAFASLIFAWLVCGLLATSPLMVVSDAVFHANKLAAVAAGDLFPVSVTQHAVPFRIPYGVSFYVLLAPLTHVVRDGVALVRWGAGLAGFAASMALFAALARHDPARAGLAVILLQLLPAGFDVYSYGNLSNAFGQSLTVVLVAWWLDRRPGGWPFGALLAFVAGIAHLSCFLVLAAFAAALWLVERGTERRAALASLVLGLGLAALYYSRFASLVLAQLPRLGEGGGQGRASAWIALASPLRDAWYGWGWPAIVLAVLGWPRSRNGRLERALYALLAAGAALGLLAVVSPVAVRYVYALTLPVSIAAAMGCSWLHVRGGRWRLAAVGLVAAQLYLGGSTIVQALLYRYR